MEGAANQRVLSRCCLTLSHFGRRVAEQFDELVEEMEDLRLACDPAWRAELSRVRQLIKDKESLRAAQERGDLITLERLEADLGLSGDELEVSDADGELPG